MLYFFSVGLITGILISCEVPENKKGPASTFIEFSDTTTEGTDSIVISKEETENLSIDSINKLATDAWRKSEFQKALTLVNVAYNRAKQIEDEQALAKTLNVLGLVYWRLGNNEDAMISFDEAGKLAEKHKLQRLLGLTYTNRGLIYKEQSNTDLAIKHNTLAIDIFRKEELYRDLGIALNNQGQIFKNLKKFDRAKTFYLEALQNYNKISYPDGEAATNYNLADIYLQEGALNEALTAGRKSLRLSLESKRKLRISEAASMLSEVHEQLNMPDSALKYFKLYSATNDTILKTNQSRTLAQFQAEMGSKVKNLQIQNLQKEKELAANKILFIIAIAAIFILLIAFLFYRYLSKIQFRKRKLESDLQISKNILHIKEQELKAYIIDLSKKNDLINRLQKNLTKNPKITNIDSEVAHLLKQKILTEEDWEKFKTKFRSIYPGFFNRIKKFRTPLTEAEIRFLVLFHLDLSNKEMAKTLGISPQSVRVCKLRLKKKLNKDGVTTVEEVLPHLIG